MTFNISLERTHRYNTRKNPTKFKLEKDSNLFPRTLVKTCVIPASTPLNLIIEDPEDRGVLWGDIIIVRQNGLNPAKCDKCFAKCSMYIKDIYVPDGARVIGSVGTIEIEFFVNWNSSACTSCPLFLHLVGYGNGKEINQYMLLRLEYQEPYQSYTSVRGYLTKKREKINHEEGSSDESAVSYTISTTTESSDTDSHLASTEWDTSDDTSGFRFSHESHESEESGPEEDSCARHLHTHQKYLVRKLTGNKSGRYDFFTGKSSMHKRGKFLSRASRSHQIYDYM
jgi:hypothetical protein